MAGILRRAPRSLTPRRPPLSDQRGRAARVSDEMVPVAACVRKQRPATRTSTVRWWLLGRRSSHAAGVETAARSGRRRQRSRLARSLARCSAGRGLQQAVGDFSRPPDSDCDAARERPIRSAAPLLQSRLRGCLDTAGPQTAGPAARAAAQRARAETIAAVPDRECCKPRFDAAGLPRSADFRSESNVEDPRSS